MPPNVRIGHAARRHGEKTQREDDFEDAAGLKKLLHQCEDNTLPRARRYKIASPLRARELFPAVY
jgi:hypothetical protein